MDETERERRHQKEKKKKHSISLALVDRLKQAIASSSSLPPSPTNPSTMNFKLQAKKTPFQRHKEEQELKRKVG